MFSATPENVLKHRWPMKADEQSEEKQPHTVAYSMKHPDLEKRSHL